MGLIHNNILNITSLNVS